MKNYLILSIFFVSFFKVPIYGHPHTFFEVYPIVDIVNKEVKRIKIKWIMDEMTSSLLIMEFDLNGNGKIDQDENLYIYENYFLFLESYGFYTTTSRNKKELEVPKPKNFKASIDKNRIIYAFELIKKYSLKDLKVSFVDKDLFVGFILEKNFITIKGIEKEINNKIRKSIFGVE